MKTLRVGGYISNRKTPKPSKQDLPIQEKEEPSKMPIQEEKRSKIDLQFFWINLDHSKKRRERMTEEFEKRGIKHQRIEAINGLKEPLGKYLGFSEVRARPHKAEIATTLSHLKAIHAFAQTGEPVGIIAEDDMIFEYEDHWPYTLDSLIHDAPTGWEVLQLSLTLGSKTGWEWFKQENKRYFERQFFWYSALTYAITHEHAMALLNQYTIPLDKPFTSQLTGNHRKMQSEWIVLGTSPNRYTVYPPAFTYPMNNTSYIHPQHLKKHEVAKRLCDKVYYN